jgi:hypothetical protein
VSAKVRHKRSRWMESSRSKESGPDYFTALGQIMFEAMWLATIFVPTSICLPQFKCGVVDGYKRAGFKGCDRCLMTVAGLGLGVLGVDPPMLTALTLENAQLLECQGGGTDKHGI